MCVLNGLDAKCMLSTSCRWNHFHESKKVFAEKIPVSEMFSPDFVTKSGDYFIISSSRSDTTLFLYKTPSLTFKNATGIKGNGPDEIQMFPMFAIH